MATSLESPIAADRVLDPIGDDPTLGGPAAVVVTLELGGTADSVDVTPMNGNCGRGLAT
jgi:hypothetical protein